MAEIAGPHMAHCPLRRSAEWRATHDRYATCHCSNEWLARALRKVMA